MDIHLYMTAKLMQDAKELRPILIDEASHGLDLLLRDRVRKSYVLSRASLQPRLPFIGTLPAPAPPPVPVPGKGMLPLDTFVDTFFPKLTDEQEVLLDTQLELMGAILGADPEEFGKFDLQTIPQLIINPTEQIRELQRTLANVSASSADSMVVRASAMEIASRVASSLATRGNVPVSTLFPFFPDAWRVEAATEGKRGLQENFESAMSMEPVARTDNTPQTVAEQGASRQGGPRQGRSIQGMGPTVDNTLAETSDSTVVVNRTAPIQMVELG